MNHHDLIIQPLADAVGQMVFVSATIFGIVLIVPAVAALLNLLFRKL
jgi:hypothetical protein